MTKDLRISATMFTTWLRCPTQAAARLEGHYSPDTINSFRGLLAHRIFARHIESGHISSSGFERVARSEIGSSNLNWKVSQLGLKPSELRHSIEHVATLYERFVKLGHHHHNYVGTEIHLEHVLDDGVTLIGTVDTATDAGTLIDWKTGELDNVEEQLDFYALVWSLSKQQPGAVMTTAISIGTGEVFTSDVSADRLAATTAKVAAMIADLRTDPPHLVRPGPYCRWCPVLESCPIGTKTLALLTG